MSKSFLTGNEATGPGVIRAGTRAVSGYPGAPSAEVLETVVEHNPGGIYVERPVNEEAGVGVAAVVVCIGVRTMVIMKQVGLNVASDPPMSLVCVGVKGGMVAIVADGPGPISSQIEQDTRYFGQFSRFPVFDSSSPKEAYEIIGDAFEYLEKYHTPVLFRPTTRICHGCVSAELEERACLPEPEGFMKDFNKWVIFPRLPSTSHKMMEGRNPMIGKDFSSYRFNLLHREDEESGKGIVTCGVNYGSVMGVLNGYQGVRIFKTFTPGPIPEKLMLELMDDLKGAMAVEELGSILEQELLPLCGKHHLDVNVRGELTRGV